MTIYNTQKQNVISSCVSPLECDMCGSKELIETNEGYVCKECGIVLEIQKLRYDRPYDKRFIQHAPHIGSTQIGTRRERASSPYSQKIYRLNKQNMRIENERVVFNKAHHAISKIFSRLDLSDYFDIKDMVLKKFKSLRENFRPGSKYRNIEKMIAIITYFCLKLRNISINPLKLIEVSELSKQEFNDFILQVQKYLPKYAERNRKEFILQRVLEITEHFKLGMEIYHLAKKILNKFWNGIKNTTDNAVAGLVSSISVLCLCKEKISISAICNRLGIRMSTVQAQVKKKIFNQFKVGGFISLIKSSDLLLKIMKKLGVLEDQVIEEIDEGAPPNRIEIVLGQIENVFNINNTPKYYFFAVRGEEKFPMIFILFFNYFALDDKSTKSQKSQNPLFLNLELLKYPTTKDPPSSGSL